MLVLDDFHQVAALPGGEAIRAPVVEAIRSVQARG